MRLPAAARAHFLLPLLPLTVFLARVSLLVAGWRRIHWMRVEAKVLMDPRIISGSRGDGEQLSSECSAGWCSAAAVRSGGRGARAFEPDARRTLRASGSNRSTSSRRRRRQPLSPPPSPTTLAAAVADRSRRRRHALCSSPRVCAQRGRQRRREARAVIACRRRRCRRCRRCRCRRRLRRRRRAVTAAR